MKKICLLLLLMFTALSGCGASQQADTLVSAEPGGKANDFNPWLREKLPNMRQLSADGAKMLGALGAKAQSIEGEAKYRKNWRGEIYPVVFGERKAPHEIIVVLNFSEPACENLWKEVVQASKSLQPAQCKIVIYGKSDENYGTDLTGFAIWLAHSRKGQAMSWISYALSRWNTAKATQKSQGQVKKFTSEYDSAPTPHDYPILYSYMTQMQPPIPANQEVALAKYCYDAGNVNMYQATQVCQYYGVSKLPAVIVDGRVLSKVSADSILAALH